MKTILIIMLSWSVLSKIGSASRIMAFLPSGSLSHHLTFRPLTQELVKRGHNVTVLSPYPMYKDKNPQTNLTEIDLSEIVMELTQKYYKNHKFGLRCKFYEQIEDAMNFVYLNHTREILQSDKLQRFLKQHNKFDIIIVEFFSRMAFALSAIYEAPIVLLSSYYVIGAYGLIGAPMHPLFYPSCNPHKVFNLSQSEIIKETVTDLLMSHTLNDVYARADIELKSIFLRVPNLGELGKNVGMLLVNVNPIWEGNRPVPLGVVHLGSIHQQQPKELPKDLKEYLDNSKHGVIYVSFGLNLKAKLFPAKALVVLVNVFAKLPYDVLWKWDADELPGRTENIKISKWFPQSDLLRHPKIKLFITQAGLHSTDDAITAGVPVLGIPAIYDQWGNAERYTHHKIGLKLEFHKLTEDNLRNTIDTLIRDNSYRQNIIKLRDLMHDQPQKPLDRAVRWIEYMLKHGNVNHLQSPAANMHWSEYYEVELAIIVMLCIILELAVIYCAAKMIFRYFVKLRKTCMHSNCNRNYR